jgi:hypothetical protein
MRISLTRILLRPPWRTIVPACVLFFGLCLAYLIWQPGLDVRDGRHDQGRNGLWLSHGWLGGDEWFIRNGKTNEYVAYRAPQSIRLLADKLRRYHITDYQGVAIYSDWQTSDEEWHYFSEHFLHEKVNAP